MCLDHVSNITFHGQLVNTVLPLGFGFRNIFVDGGVYSRFGNRNFAALLPSGQYIEGMFRLDQSAHYLSPSANALSKCASND